VKGVSKPPLSKAIFVTCWFRHLHWRAVPVYGGDSEEDKVSIETCRLLNQRNILDKMILGKVVGTIVTTISHKDYKNRRLLVVQPLLMDGESISPDDDFIALDNTQAGIGDTVLVNREGNGARQALKNPDAAVISVIVGIVDSVYLES